MREVEPGSREWAQSVAQEHLLLEREIATVRQWWQERDELSLPGCREMASRVRRLRDRVVEHFAEEQIGGFFRHLAMSEQQSRRACQLEAQHATLRRRLDDLLQRLESGAPDAATWRGAGDELDEFLAVLQEHEANENRIFAQSSGLELQAVEEASDE
ncbi:hypothetical protein GC176_14465 [bacterium]|nr:hypothetical protein [bacterium]